MQRFDVLLDLRGRWRPVGKDVGQAGVERGLEDDERQRPARSPGLAVQPRGQRRGDLSGRRQVHGVQIIDLDPAGHELAGPDGPPEGGHSDP